MRDLQTIQAINGDIAAYKAAKKNQVLQDRIKDIKDTVDKFNQLQKILDKMGVNANVCLAPVTGQLILTLKGE